MLNEFQIPNSKFQILNSKFLAMALGAALHVRPRARLSVQKLQEGHDILLVLL